MPQYDINHLWRQWDPSDIPIGYIVMFNNWSYYMIYFCNGIIVSDDTVMGKVILFSNAQGTNVWGNITVYYCTGF